MSDDGKTLFDFLPGKPDAIDDDGTPTADDGDPALKEAVLAALKTVRDPEIPVNLVDLGLIYDLCVSADGKVYVEMTLTSPSCPVAGSLPLEVEKQAESVDEVLEADVVLVWDPPWDKSRMSEAAQLMLNV